MAIEDAERVLRTTRDRFDAFVQSINTWRAAHPNAHSVFVRTVGSKAIFCAQIHDEPPAEWSDAIGTIVGDLRKALDYAVYACAEANASAPLSPAEQRALQFPIFVDETEFRRRGLKQIRSLSAEAISYLESIQPWQRPEPSRDVLHALSVMAGIAKHRLPPPVWTVLNSTAIRIVSDGSAVPTTLYGHVVTGALRDGAPVFEMGLKANQQISSMTLDVQLNTHVGFDEAALGFAGDVVESLGIFGGVSVQIVNELRQFAQ